MDTNNCSLPSSLHRGFQGRCDIDVDRLRELNAEVVLLAQVKEEVQQHLSSFFGWVANADWSVLGMGELNRTRSSHRLITVPQATRVSDLLGCSSQQLYLCPTRVKLLRTSVV